MAKTSFIADGKSVSVDGDPQMPLLYALRDDLKISAPKFGCGLAQCGACTVQVDGEPTGAGEATSRVVPAAVANAFFDATGVRLRRAPMTPARVLAALARA